MPTNDDSNPRRRLLNPRRCCKGFIHLMTHNSIARYGVLILLVAFISILYFATTHQVLRPAGSGPTISSESYFVMASNDTQPNGYGVQYQKLFDQNDGEVIQYGDVRRYPRKEVQGFLYNRGKGCSVNSIENNIPLPPNLEEDRVGLISIDSTDTTDCDVSTKIQNSLDNDTDAMIFWSPNKRDYGLIKKALEPFNDKNDKSRRQILIFSVNANASDKWIEQLQDLYESYNSNDTDKSSGYQVLRVTMKSSQPIYASSWLFAMFAVGGVLVVSFFISILIHMRIYRRRQTQQEEIERHRANEDTLGMKKWTLDKETVDAFPVIIYSTKISPTEKEPKSDNINTNNNINNDDDNVKDVKVKVENVKVEDEKVNDDENKNIKSEEVKNVKVEDEKVIDEKVNDEEENKNTKREEEVENVIVEDEKVNDDDENKNTKSEEDLPQKHQSDDLRRHYSLRSIRSFKSFRSTRSTKSTKSQRSVRAIGNATALYASPSVETHSEGSTVESPIDLIATSETRETCAICLEDFDDGDEIRELPCRHWYHVECIDPWLITKSSSCPLCKNDCKPKNLSEGDDHNIQGNTIIQERESQATQVIDNNQDSSTNPSIRGNNTVTHLMINALDLLFGSRRRMRRRRGQQNGDNDVRTTDLEIGNTQTTSTTSVTSTTSDNVRTTDIESGNNTSTTSDNNV